MGERITKRGRDARQHLRGMTNRKAAAFPLENAEVRSVRTLKSKPISNRQEMVNCSCSSGDALGAAVKLTDPEGQQIQDEIVKPPLDSRYKQTNGRTDRQRLVWSPMVESTADL